MARLLFVLAVCGLALGWLHAEDKPAAQEPSNPFGFSQPDVKPSLRVRIPVKKQEVVDQRVDGVIRKTEVTRTTVTEQQIPVPTDPEEIQKLRDELKAFRQQQIDALEVDTLVRQVYEERAAAREKEAWAKLEEVRKTLQSLENEYDGTKAGDVSRQLQRQIPDSLKAAMPGAYTDPFGGRKAGSSGTTIPLPRDSVRFGTLSEPEIEAGPLKEI